jgi:hypothetical protein
MIILREFLNKKKKSIVAEWFKATLGTYTVETSKFLKEEKDDFANPVGNIVRNSLDGIFSELIGSMNIEKIKKYLDAIIRIRAIQAFSPSNAVSFILFLKSILKKELLKKFTIINIESDFFAIEKKIDEILLIGFDVYSQCREQLNEIKSNELRDRTYKAFERAGLVKEID